jgi:RNA polymerase sigma-70 factor (ECF subfamily)
MAPLDEATLARAAAAGDGQAFARLYDEYEGRIYNFCLRIVGGPEDAADATQDAFLKVLQRLPKIPADRELNFGAYLFTAARNASYDVIGKRKKADPVDLIPETGARPLSGDERGALDLDPERASMLAALQVSVQAANARLPERQREVLALREVEELSYDEIADIMEMNRNSVAQLISRARIKLRDELQGSALASIPSASPACAKALPLISLRQDGQLRDEDDRDWLEQHVGDCPTCRVSVEAMAEAGMSYRAWAPVLPVAWLWKATAAKAMDLTGGDWTELLDRQRELHSGSPGAGSGPGSGAAGAGSAGGVAGAAGTTATAQAERASASVSASGPAADGAAHHGRRRRRAAASTGTMLLVILLGLLLLGREEVPATLDTGTIAAQLLPPAPATTTAAAPVPAVPATPAPKAKQAKKQKAKTTKTKPVVVTVPSAAGGNVPITVRAPVVVPATQTPAPTRVKTPTRKPPVKVPTGTSGTSITGTGPGSGVPAGMGATPPATTTPDPPPATTTDPGPTVTVDPGAGATYCDQNPTDARCRPCSTRVCRRSAPPVAPPVFGVAIVPATAAAEGRSAA